MQIPASNNTPEFIATEAATSAGSPHQNNTVELQIFLPEKLETKSDYSLLVKGDITRQSGMTKKANISITELGKSKQLVSGFASASPDTFVLAGEITAVEFEDPKPTIEINGTALDSSRWPDVSEYINGYSVQEPVADPFLTNGVLGSSPTDPLNPDEYRIELCGDSLSEPKIYSFSFDGSVLNYTDGVTVSEEDQNITGTLQPNHTATIVLRGLITEINPHDRIDFEITPR